jgi:hypothetical protein
MRQQVPKFLGKAIGLFFIGKVPVSLAPSRECPYYAINHLLKGILSFWGTQDPPKVLLGHDI